MRVVDLFTVLKGTNLIRLADDDKSLCRQDFWHKYGNTPVWYSRVVDVTTVVNDDGKIEVILGVLMSLKVAEGDYTLQPGDEVDVIVPEHRMRYKVKEACYMSLGYDSALLDIEVDRDYDSHKTEEMYDREFEKTFATYVVDGKNGRKLVGGGGPLLRNPGFLHLVK